MLMNARLMIATAILAATASTAMAQSARYDYQDDKPLSYGPRHPDRAAARTANPAQAPVGRDLFNPYDRTDDKSLSYGVRPRN
jgi:hypothetical protein